MQQHLLVAAATVDPSPAFQSRGSSRIVVLVAAATVDTDLQNQPSLPRLTDGCADGPGFENLSLPKSFQFCAGGAAEISRWRQPPESPSLLPLRPGRGAGPWRDPELFRRIHSRPAPLPGREELVAWTRWLAPPANIRRPSRAKSSNRESRKFWVMTSFQSRDNERIRPQSRQRRLSLPINLNHRCRDWNEYVTAPPALKSRARLNRRWRG